MTSRASIQYTAGDWAVARWMLLIRPAIVTATLGVFLLMIPPGMLNTAPIVIALGGTYLLTLLYWLAFRIGGMSKPVLFTQIAFDVFLITIIIHYTGGMGSPFVQFYFLPIMCGSLFFRRVLTFFFAAQCAVFYSLYSLVIGPLMMPGEFVMTVSSTTLVTIAIYTMLFFVIGVISSYYAENLRGKDSALTNALRLLREAKLDTSDILQSMTNGLITVDMEGRLMYLNRVAVETLGLERGRLVGESYREVFRNGGEELARLIGEWLGNRRDFTEEEIEVHVSPDTSIPIGLTSMPLFGVDGSRRGIIINFKDLTEKNKLLEMIRQTERMAAIGELSAAIAHEIRNPLASIGNAVELLSDSLPGGDNQTRKLISIIDRESARLQRITSDFLRFARIRQPERVTVSLREVVDDALVLLKNDPRFSPSIAVRTDIVRNAKVHFDVDQLRQLVLNIFINSLDALEGEGTITIRSEPVSLEGCKALRLVIADDGPGFPGESMGRMFEPFYSTKKDGTGLGLALVRKIAVANGGRVFARNGAEGGAEIALDMPAGGEADG